MDIEKNKAQEYKSDVMPIVIDDGCIDIPIQNQFGERLGVFRFNPTDVNIINRYNEVVDRIPEILRPLAGAEIDPNGEGGDENSIELLNTAGAEIEDLLDYVLNGNSREAFFTRTHVFSPVGGKFYCEKVLEAIGAFISKKFEAEVKKMSARAETHMHGYRTGKHRKGDR